jgi:hypothetical protein
MFIFLDFSLNTSRPIKMEGVYVHYQVEQTYFKIRTIGEREEMTCLISFEIFEVESYVISAQNLPL